ncbi:hypothetical protein AUEXF2481DRAFT_42084 [Aureobasidium subglaciale EXF-2481]|uniref:F-box domain-containing protein n=1 Tax=Aureobasidium subglaciale (strain EXF-2481) TaxID=1043005 RepID=A0A074Y6M5_AURSE|nr:uncharacterized protein AUEXF2481DRAFT_42084 [Aureobasidium subglaciale EXF-2481]KEQ93355.1 hypothetical protein AUEXF2481DRAFT_42084 [Aureobasidium subglaciale EXF-2481]
MLLRLPNELLVRTADFLPDGDLPAIRLTCKHPVLITHKHFIAAFITETYFEASLSGIQRLIHIVSHPTFGPYVKKCMASTKEGPLVHQDKCEKLLAHVFTKLSLHGHCFDLSILCYHPALNIYTSYHKVNEILH